MNDKTRTEDQTGFYMRFHQADVYRALLNISEQTGQPMREIVERALRFAFAARDFRVPAKKTTADKLAESRERKKARLAARAANMVPKDPE